MFFKKYRELKRKNKELAEKVVTLTKENKRLQEIIKPTTYINPISNTSVTKYIVPLTSTVNYKAEYLYFTDFNDEEGVKAIKDKAKLRAINNLLLGIREKGYIEVEDYGDRMIAHLDILVKED